MPGPPEPPAAGKSPMIVTLLLHIEAPDITVSARVMTKAMDAIDQATPYQVRKGTVVYSPDSPERTGNWVAGHPMTVKTVLYVEAPDGPATGKGSSYAARTSVVLTAAMNAIDQATPYTVRRGDVVPPAWALAAQRRSDLGLPLSPGS